MKSEAEGNVDSHLYSRGRRSNKPFSCAATLGHRRERRAQEKHMEPEFDVIFAYSIGSSISAAKTLVNKVRLST